MPLFASNKKKTARQKLRVFVFASVDWGFTDAAVPKLRALVAKLEEEGADLDVLPSSLTVRFFGDQKEDVFGRARSLLEEALHDSDFSGFVLGTSEGMSEHKLDVMRIAGDAFKNARRG